MAAPSAVNHHIPSISSIKQESISMPPMPKPPGPVTRHLTTLLPFSSSVFAPPRMVQLTPKPATSTGKSPGQFGNLFVTGKAVPNVRDHDLSETDRGLKCLVAEQGANFRVTDIAPRTKGAMHTTESLDFLIVHKGQVTLHLDSGEKAMINEGEVIVQRGTVHAWENETDDWVRMFVVLIQADK